MKFSYNILLVPENYETQNIDDVRCVNLERQTRFINRDELRADGTREAASSGKIDEYAVRNFWKVGACDMKVTDAPWEGLKNCSEYLHEEYGTGKPSRVNKDKYDRSLEYNFSSEKKRVEMENNMQSDHGKLPLSGTKTQLRVTIQSKANVGMNSYHDAKKIFDKI